MTLFKIFISLIFYFFVNQAYCETIKTELIKHQNDVKASFDKLSKTNRKFFSYTITKYENEEGDETSSIENHSPSSNDVQSWSLIEFNGKRPSEKQIKTYIENKSKKVKKKKNNQTISISQLVDVNTLKILTEDSNVIKSSFMVGYTKFGEDAKKKLEGILTFDKKNHYVKSIEITNKENFSPMFSVDISQLKLTLSFIKIKDAILPRGNTMRLIGSMAMFVEIDEISTVDYSNYTL